MKGEPLPWRLVLRLQRHHSRPFVQLLSMGKNSWNRAPWKSQDDGQRPAGGWSYWHGSWKSRQPGHGQDSGQDKKEHAFPAYSTMNVAATKVDGAPPKPGMGPDQEDDAESTDLLRQIQQQLNKSRRVDGRLRKLVSDLQQKHGQWEAFQKNLQLAFHTERKSYMADVAALEKEIREAQQAKDMAMRNLLSLTDPQAPAASRATRVDVATPEGNRAWEALIAQGAAEDCEMMDEDLQHALMVAQNPQAFADAVRRRQTGASQPSLTRGMD